MKKFIFFFLLLLLIPLVSASHNEPDECGLTNLGSCIVKKLSNFLLLILNAPFIPLIGAITELLVKKVRVDIFFHAWSIIRYILGFFYIFLLVYAGSIFLTSNANPIRRAHAKDLLKNIVLMLVLIQASYFMYELILDLSSILNGTIVSIIDFHFFYLDFDNIVNIGLQFYFSIFYGMILFITMLLLALRYIIVSFGIVLLPIGIFFYFLPPLKEYGKFILNLLGIFIFITFFDLLIILVCSMIVKTDLFSYFKIIITIACFMLVNYTLWLAFKFALKKSTNVSLKDDLQQAVKYIALAV